ncbi:MAG TPA: AbgT family transporter, partial [Bryobacteraceae bacterium]|nr:AbgT family transporter [Bryobacteraceae bacterium]
MPASANALHRALNFVEYAGNKLPHPASLFAIFALLVIALSWLLVQFGLTAVHPGTGKEINAVNLLSDGGLRRMLTSLVTNFTGFVPLGTVLVAMLGVGVAEGSGLLGAALKGMVLAAPKRLITVVVVFTGVMSNAASEAGYVILIPLAAVIFLAVGRHPLAGLAAAFAGVSGGYSANLVLGTVDPLLSGLTTEGARIIDPAYYVNPAANYYFMAISTFLITMAGTIVTHRLVEPRLGKFEGDAGAKIEKLGPGEKRGLKAAGFALLVTNVLLVLSVVPESGILRNPETGSILDSPFLSGIVAIIFLMFLIPGLAYGIAAGTIRNDTDVVNFMGKT